MLCPFLSPGGRGDWGEGEGQPCRCDVRCLSPEPIDWCIISPSICLRDARENCNEEHRPWLA